MVRSQYPILRDTAEVIADPLVRNMATVGGNLAHGDPANDHPATMLALGAAGRGDRAQGRADHPDRPVLHRSVPTALRAGRDADGDPHPGAAAAVAAAPT